MLLKYSALSSILSSMRQGAVTLSGTPTSTSISHLDFYICPFVIIWGVVLANAHGFRPHEKLAYLYNMYTTVLRYDCK